MNSNEHLLVQTILEKGAWPRLVLTKLRRH
uniref:Uncharacterized protein n=1 Tax=Arundo donax TaxID=35708 RepID=A0A0A8XZZ7_ARUDO